MLPRCLTSVALGAELKAMPRKPYTLIYAPDVDAHLDAYRAKIPLVHPRGNRGSAYLRARCWNTEPKAAA